MENENNSQFSTLNSPLIPPGYKQTEVGVIPEDWQVQCLGNVARVIGGGAFKSQDAQQTGIRWLKIANVGINEIVWNDESFLPEEFARMHGSFLLKQGDCVLALTRPILGGILKIAMICKDDAPALLNQRVGKIEGVNNNDLDFLYFVFQLGSTVSAMQQSMAGTDPPNLSTRNIYTISCAIPPSKIEQRAIAEALSDADALIESLEQLIVKKRRLKQGARQELLTGKRRLQGFANATIGYKQTEVGVIPEDWEVTNLATVSSEPMQNGVFYKPSHKGVGVKLINVGDLYKRIPIDTDSLELFDANENERERFKVEDGDLFFTRSSVVPSGIAHCNIYKSNRLESVVFDSHVIRVRPDNRKVVPSFLFRFGASSVARKYLVSHAKTATMTTIDQGVLGKCPVLLPTKDEQEAIAEGLSDMDTEIIALETRLAKTRAIKQGMMHVLLTGRIRLSG